MIRAQMRLKCYVLDGYYQEDSSTANVLDTTPVSSFTAILRLCCTVLLGQRTRTLLVLLTNHMTLTV